MTRLARFPLLATPILAALALAGCSGGSSPSNGGGSSSSSSTEQVCSGPTANFTATSFSTIGSWSSGNNVMSVTVNGSLCTLPRSEQYANEPCVSVTLCSPSNPSDCQTLDNILLDTGSYGLRIFSSVITVPLTPITSGASSLAECVQFGDGSSEWGPVEYAYVQLGGEPKVAVPILAINSSYNTAPDPCSSSQSTPDSSPSEAGFNGILGVGLLAQDCGDYCVTNPDSEQYYTCTSGNCACGATVALGAQVENPVAAIPTDNNGVIVDLGSVTGGEATSLTGSLYLGIGTQADNAASGVTAYAANSNPDSDTYLEFSTVFSAYASGRIPSFIDSGSNMLFIPPISALPNCGNTYGSGYSGFYCPTSTYTGSAVNFSSTGSPSGTVGFSIANAYTLLNSGNFVFSELGGDGGSGSSALFDWGLPFFLGREVYVGIDGASSSLGTGPYWAY